MHTRIAFFIGALLFAVPSFALASFDTSLSFGARGDSVVSIQEFLISQHVLSGDNATGYFGKLTQAAVKKFQQSQNISPISGYFGPLTRARANSLALTSQDPLSLAHSMLSASPSSGPNPIAVSFAANFSGNAPGNNKSYADGIFSINFGDGTSANATQLCSATSCTVTAVHAYTIAGTFAVSLSWTPTCHVLPGEDCAIVNYRAGSTNVIVTGNAAARAILSPSLTSSHKLPVDISFDIIGQGGPYQLDYGDGTAPSTLGYLSAGASLSGLKRYTQSGTYFVRLLSNGTVLDTVTITLDTSLCDTATKKLMLGQIDGEAFGKACF